MNSMNLKHFAVAGLFALGAAAPAASMAADAEAGKAKAGVCAACHGQNGISQVPIYPKRSEEHPSELQSRPHLVCRLLLEKKKQRTQRGRMVLATARSPLVDDGGLARSGVGRSVGRNGRGRHPDSATSGTQGAVSSGPGPV